MVTADVEMVEVYRETVASTTTLSTHVVPHRKVGAVNGRRAHGVHESKKEEKCRNC